MHRLLITLIFLCAVLGHQTSTAQTSNSAITKVRLINEITDLFNNSFSVKEKIGCSINIHGKVTEWDSIALFSLTYQLSEIDWSNSEIVIEDSETAVIQAYCIGQQYCITGTAAKNKKNFYTHAALFSLPVSKTGTLDAIQRKLIKLKQLSGQ